MVEMQFGDFITCGFNQIVNNLAKTHYRWGAPVPVVVRVPVGGGMRRRAVPLAERRVLVHERGRASRWWRRPRPSTRRACCSRRSRTATPCSSSSTSSSTARRRERVPAGLLHAAHRQGARRARGHATPRSSPTASAWPGRSTRPSGWPRRAATIEVIDLRIAAALGPRDGARLGAQDGPRAGAARGAAHRRLRRRGGGDHRPARPSSGWTRRSRAWARSTRRSRSARRSKRSSLPGRGCSGAARPAGVLRPRGGG